MTTADLITSFLDNEMSPNQEREFLLSVAASDSLRLELKSHVMLDRIFTQQAQRTQVPDAIRSTILAQAGVAIAGQGAPEAGRLPRASHRIGGRTRSFFKAVSRASMLLLAVIGFAGGYVVGSGGSAPRAESNAGPNVPQREPASLVQPQQSAASTQSSDANATRLNSLPAPVVTEARPNRSMTPMRTAHRPSASANARQPIGTAIEAPQNAASPSSATSQAASPSAATPTETGTPTDVKVSPPANASVKMNVKKPSEKDRKNPPQTEQPQNP
jgi:hypothetical protein